MYTSFAIEWTAALRSGLGQIPGVLHSKGVTGTKDKFCCLGVACKLLADDGKLTSEPVGSLVMYGPTSYTLPKEAQELMGVSEKFGDCGSFMHIEGAQAWMARDERFSSAFDGHSWSDYPKDLAALNDRGVTFEAIADFIEEFRFYL